MLGVLCNGAFAEPAYVALLGRSQSADAYDCGGFFLSKADGGLQLGMQLLGGCMAFCFRWLVGPTGCVPA
jgi:hypothetical protein